MGLAAQTDASTGAALLPVRQPSYPPSRHSLRYRVRQAPPAGPQSSPYCRDGIARALYVTAVGKRVVILRAFRKKSQKTPRREIELALRRAEEVE